MKKKNEERLAGGLMFMVFGAFASLAALEKPLTQAEIHTFLLESAGVAKAMRSHIQAALEFMLAEDLLVETAGVLSLGKQGWTMTAEVFFAEVDRLTPQEGN